MLVRAVAARVRANEYLMGVAVAPRALVRAVTARVRANEYRMSVRVSVRVGSRSLVLGATRCCICACENE